MVRLVVPTKASLSTRCTAASVCSSTFDDGSSMTTSFVLRSSARATPNNCFSPADREPPSALTTWSSASAPSPAASSARRLSGDPCSSKGSRFRSTDPLSSTLSWGTMDTRFRRAQSPTKATSSPSMSTRPASGSTRRSTSATRLDLPAPVRPMTPTLVPPSTYKFRCSSAGGRPGR